MKKNLLFTGLLIALSTISYAQEPETKIIHAQDPTTAITTTSTEQTPLTKEQLKDFNRKQKQLAKETKAELKKQQNIAKTEKSIQKNSTKLNKLKTKYANENNKLNAKMAKGKVTPVDELKAKTRIQKLNSQITNLEFNLKTDQAKLESLKK